MKKPLICIIGRTGTGKSTIARWMCEKYGLKQVRSYATRPMRPGEEKISDHIFIKPEDVEKHENDAIDREEDKHEDTSVDRR